MLAVVGASMVPFRCFETDSLHWAVSVHYWYWLTSQHTNWMTFVPVHYSMRLFFVKITWIYSLVFVFLSYLVFYHSLFNLAWWFFSRSLLFVVRRLRCASQSIRDMRAISFLLSSQFTISLSSISESLFHLILDSLGPKWFQNIDGRHQFNCSRMVFDGGG